MTFRRDKQQMIARVDALPGRPEALAGSDAVHAVLGTRIGPPYPDGDARAMFGMGCFWGAERHLWQVEGVYTTAAGYTAGFTPNPTYDEVCTARTGHNEVALAVYDPATVEYGTLLKVFWEVHDPTQFMGQGNDIGTQYRSEIYVYDDAQRAAAERSRDIYQARLSAAGYGEITTRIVDAGVFYLAEDHHQQYLAKNPGGYCNHGFCQVDYP